MAAVRREERVNGCCEGCWRERVRCGMAEREWLSRVGGTKGRRRKDSNILQCISSTITYRMRADT